MASRGKCDNFYEVWLLFLKTIVLFIWTKMKLPVVLGHILEVLNCHPVDTRIVAAVVQAQVVSKFFKKS